MTSVNGNNPANTALFTQISSSLKDDNRIDKKELKALNELVASSDLSPEVKEAVNNLLGSAKKASDGFLWIFGRDISNKELSGLNQELGKLKELVGDNAVGKELCNVIESSLPKSDVQAPRSSGSQPDTSAVTPYKASSFDPVGSVSDFFKRIFSPSSNAGNAGSATSTGNMTSGVATRDNVSSFHKSQYGTGLPSESGDCGPTSGAMILEAFGVPSDVASVRNNAPNNTSGPGRWALGESQISGSIEKLSGGSVTQSGETKKYAHGSNNSQIMNDIKSQLAEGKLLMLCTGVNGAPNNDSRHYTVITGIDSNGNIQIADPGQPSGSNGYTITPEQLAAMMNCDATRERGGTSLTAYQKNN